MCTLETSVFLFSPSSCVTPVAVRLSLAFFARVTELHAWTSGGRGETIDEQDNTKNMQAHDGSHKLKVHNCDKFSKEKFKDNS